MKQVITYEFEESDFELLMKGLPDTPCDKCSTPRDSCCGCKDYEIYRSEENKFKEANLYEYGKVLAEIKKLYKEKIRIQNEILELWWSLPEEIKARKNIKEWCEKI